MSTTISPLVVSEFPRLAESDRVMKELVTGLDNAVAEAEVPALFAAIRQGQPGEIQRQAFEAEVVHEAIVATAAQMADLLTDAIRRRLPWTYRA